VTLTCQVVTRQAVGTNFKTWQCMQVWHTVQCDAPLTRLSLAALGTSRAIKTCSSTHMHTHTHTGLFHIPSRSGSDTWRRRQHRITVPTPHKQQWRPGRHGRLGRQDIAHAVNVCKPTENQSQKERKTPKQQAELSLPTGPTVPMSPMSPLSPLSPEYTCTSTHTAGAHKVSYSSQARDYTAFGCDKVLHNDVLAAVQLLCMCLTPHHVRHIHHDAGVAYECMLKPALVQEHMDVCDKLNGACK
jgi:hypothetical protein